MSVRIIQDAPIRDLLVNVKAITLVSYYVEQEWLHIHAPTERKFRPAYTAFADHLHTAIGLTGYESFDDGCFFWGDIHMGQFYEIVKHHLRCIFVSPFFVRPGGN